MARSLDYSFCHVSRAAADPARAASRSLSAGSAWPSRCSSRSSIGGARRARLDVRLVVGRHPRGRHRLHRDGRLRPVRAVAEAAAALASALGPAGRRASPSAMPIVTVDHLHAVHGRRRPALLGGPAAHGGLRDADRPRRLPVAVGRARRTGAAEGGAGARAGARVRPRAQRSRAPGAGCAAEPAAGAGGAALPVQHAGERAGTRRRRLAEGAGGAAQPRRLPARRGAAANEPVDDARPGAGARARLPRADAHAHARPPRVRRCTSDAAAKRCAARR